MKKYIPAAVFILALVLLAGLSRRDSPGSRIAAVVDNWAAALAQGRSGDALLLMLPDSQVNYCPEFLLNLRDEPVPDRFVYSGIDSRGIMLSGETPDRGSRVIWVSSFDDPRIVHDTALDNLLGMAVLLCRENAALNPGGVCPVSGRPYEYDETLGLVICPDEHLGDGLSVGSDRCSLRRDSVSMEVAAYVQAGYQWPETLEEMYLESSGEFGRRGGYRCPDNGYSYYEIRDVEVFCPFHGETTVVGEE